MMEIRKTRAQMHADAHVASKSVKPTYVDQVQAQAKSKKKAATPAPQQEGAVAEENEWVLSRIARRQYI